MESPKTLDCKVVCICEVDKHAKYGGKITNYFKSGEETAPIFGLEKCHLAIKNSKIFKKS